MNITKKELIELNACRSGLLRFTQQTNGTDAPVDVASLIGGENTYGDLLWLAGRKLPKERIVRFACDCALLNVEKIKPYTDKYDLIEQFLREPSADAAARAAYAAARADAAARAAYAAARAAYAAARAAYAAARAAAAAARAAAAAYAAAAAAAAYAAAYAAARVGSREQVDRLLADMFNEVE